MNKLFVFTGVVFFSSLVTGSLFGFATVGTSLSRVVVVQNVEDINLDPVIQAAFAATGTNPNTWSFQTISSSLNTNISFSPKIFSNQSGDFVVLWSYIDLTSGNQELAAAVLLNSLSLWQVDNISHGLGIPENADYEAVFDDLGNVLVVWSSYLGGHFVSMITTTSLSSISWSAPYIFPY